MHSAQVAHLARLAHEVNRAYCASLGDLSQPRWEDAPEWQRTSAIAGVEFTLANPEAPPSASHESWLKQKRADGWAYGPEKDPERKLHPCFVPYDQLPPEQRAKDYLFQGVVRAASAAVMFAPGDASPSALGLVRLGFNPSGLSAVDQFKLLTAFLVTLLEPIRDARGDGGRCAAVAITRFEEAAMWAVKAATAGK